VAPPLPLPGVELIDGGKGIGIPGARGEEETGGAVGGGRKQSEGVGKPRGESRTASPRSSSPHELTSPFHDRL
jgi:hypothetical protein